MSDRTRTLDGKTALVCGGSRGIGRACGMEFAGLGARVILVARSWDALAAARERLGSGEHETLAVELAPFGITVNNLLPGATRTDRLSEIIRERARASGRSEKEIETEMIREIPTGRIGNPEEVAAAAGFLAGPRAAYITGVSLPVDGGRTSAL